MISYLSVSVIPLSSPFNFDSTFCIEKPFFIRLLLLLDRMVGGPSTHPNHGGADVYKYLINTIK